MRALASVLAQTASAQQALASVVVGVCVLGLVSPEWRLRCPAWFTGRTFFWTRTQGSPLGRLCHSIGPWRAFGQRCVMRHGGPWVHAEPSVHTGLGCGARGLRPLLSRRPGCDCHSGGASHCKQRHGYVRCSCFLPRGSGCQDLSPHGCSTSARTRLLLVCHCLLGSRRPPATPKIQSELAYNVRVPP